MSKRDQHHIAVDIGASSGRVVWGEIQQDGNLTLTEIHRFKNGFAEKGGHLYWDMDYLYAEIVEGLRQAKTRGIDRCTVGIDTWAVDYVLVGRNGERIHEVYAYRDSRTEGAAEELHRKFPFEVIYAKTGIQYLSFNTLYQLYVHDKQELQAAESILLVPDYLYFRLTGRKISEVTNASTTALLNLHTRDYDEELLSLLGLARTKFPPLTQPGEPLGGLDIALAASGELPECQFIAAASHDTASAVLGVPAAGREPWAYLSSGTWSLIGVERKAPIAGPDALKSNYTNEWGAYGTTRFLKNIMGMWLIQKVHEENGGRYSYGELVELAASVQPFRSIIYPNAERFLNPSSMTGEIRRYCAETGQPLPHTLGEIARCIFDSLALSYYCYVKDLEQLTGERIGRLHIVGGGSNNMLLCRITADLLGIAVHAGPTESTALGNLAVQLISSGEIRDIHEVRDVIHRSFGVTVYEPQATLEDMKAAALAKFSGWHLTIRS
ncbi:rhamnulokinase [Paenibacillus albidus]|uniref:rhamnulokinase n=1 Tax=Paenibacillus albidus TaxID=2041023 RepID=UPI001BEBAE9D|nr:rhamnulokinase [Paenibacillus albidus]MBT2291172.1 rhamnulokinase [Paenibacillus albidus]